MQKKHFYTHLVETTRVTLEIADLQLTPEERVHLLSLVDANIHSAVIETVLSVLKADEKKEFLKNLTQEDHEKTWLHLKEKADGIEEKLRERIGKITEELLNDIKEARNE